MSTGVLFVDLQAAAERAEVFEGGASFEPFVREWDTTSAELEGAIRDTSHLLWEERADE